MAGRSMENEMKRKIFPLSAAIMLGAFAAFASETPALAAQSPLSQFIFGKAYNDGVTAVQITPQARHDGDLPISVIYATPNAIRYPSRLSAPMPICARQSPIAAFRSTMS